MKKLLTIAALCTALLLTGCSKEEHVTVDGSTVTFERAAISVAYPEGWETYSGEAVYESMYNSYSDTYDSIDDMKAAFEEDGMSYYSMGYSQSFQTIVGMTSMDMTPAEDEESVPLEDYARTVHDSAIFDYLASGYKTGDDSSFSRETYGGQTGYLSHFEIFNADGEEKTFYVGFSEFMFQIDMELYSIQVCYFSEDEKAEALSIFDNITAA